MEKILVVGSGVTGALCASLLKHDILYNISVWDKARGAGGRMSTSRNPEDPNCTVDLGAQYISAIRTDYQNHQRFYNDLVQTGIIAPLRGVIEGDNRFSDEGTKHFIAPGGVSTIVKQYLQNSGASVQYNQKISDISQLDGKWTVTSETETNGTFDKLILTMPVPQILHLKGTISSIIDSQPIVQKALENVSYSSRYALGLFYKPGTKIDLPWSAKYFEKHPCIRFVAIDNKKRGIESTEIGPSVTVHTSAPFSIKHLEDDLDRVCNDIVLPDVMDLLPQLPKPVSVKNHRWRYSQVHKGYEGQPGAIVLHTNPLLVLTGDAFSKSGFDGCIDSALTTLELFQKNKL